MDRLPEQVVEWHNRHPLAKRISIYDVHTIGVVALPFMRTGGTAGLPPGQMIEPVLTDAVSAESLAAWGSEDSTVAANTNAAHLDALADQEEAPAPPPPPKAGLLQRLLALGGRGGGADKAATGGRSWAAFSERFVENLPARRIAAFAEQHGYSVRPGDASWPQRVVPIDDRLMSRKDVAGGAWPYEIWLMSAAIDAGRSRTRVLAGRTAGAAEPPMLGKRCLDPKRVGLASLIPLCLAGGIGAAIWQRGHAPQAEVVTAAASAPALASASSGMTTAPPVHVAEQAPSAPASEPAPAVSAAIESAVATVALAASEPASEAVPDIRPRLVERSPLQADRPPAPPLRAAEAAASASATATATASAPVATAKAAPAVEAAPTKAADVVATVTPDVRETLAKGGQVVALVGPATRNKAEAEALLAKMRELVLPMQPDSREQLQAQLFESPEGWRAAIWPFSSRIEAQLINATLVARGLHTKAVNF